MTQDRKYLLDLGLKLLAGAVALFGVWKYFADIEHERRIDARGRALEMIERYGAAEMREARRALFEFWVSRPEIVAYLEAGPVSARAYGNFIRAAFAEQGAGPDLNRALYRVSGFFDELHFCIESEVCDRDIALRYFCPAATRLDPLYAPVIEGLRLRSGYDAYGAGLSETARSCA